MFFAEVQIKVERTFHCIIPLLGGHVLSAEVNIFSYVCPCHIFSKWQNSLYSEKVENVSEYMENTTNLTVSRGFKNVPGPQMNVVFSLAL